MRDCKEGDYVRCRRASSVELSVRKNFGVFLRRARTAAGLTLPALAVEAKLPKSVISTIENGKGNPSLITLHKLACALGVQIKISPNDQAY